MSQNIDWIKIFSFFLCEQEDELAESNKQLEAARQMYTETAEELNKVEEEFESLSKVCI